MSKWYRYFAGVAAVTAFALTSTGCSGQSEGQSTEGQTIKVLVSAGHQQFNPLWEALPEFEKATGIKVQLDKVDTPELLSTFLRDATAGGCTYDNVEIPDDGTAAAAPQMADIAEFLKSDGDDIDTLMDKQVGWAKDAMTFDGKVKFYPFYSGALTVAYRQDLFEDPANKAAFQAKYGYELPEAPTTQDQFVDLAEFFSTNGPGKGVVFAGQGDSAEVMMADVMFRAGVGGYQDEKGNALWGPEHPDNQKAVAEAATWMTDLIKRGFTPSSLTAMGTAEATDEFLAGNVAMEYEHIYLVWSDLVSDSAKAAIGEVGSFDMPSAVEGKGGVPFYFGRGIPECSKHKEAAWEFMKWAMSDENQKLALTKGEGIYVPTNKALLDWTVQQNILPQGVADSLLNAQYYKVTPATAQLRQINTPAVENLFGGQTTPEEYAQQTGTEMQDAVEKAGVVQK